MNATAIPGERSRWQPLVSSKYSRGKLYDVTKRALKYKIV